jgi:WD40 repeat protein
MRYNLPDTMQGKQVRCKKCGNVFPVNGNAAPPAAARQSVKAAPPPAPAPTPASVPVGAQDQSGAPSEPAKKSGSGTVAIILGVVAIGFLGCLGLGGGAAWYFWPSKQQREVAERQAAENLFNDLAKDMSKDMPADMPVPQVKDGKVTIPNPDKGQPPIELDPNKIDPSKLPDPSKLVPDAGKVIEKANPPEQQVQLPDVLKPDPKVSVEAWLILKEDRPLKSFAVSPDGKMLAVGYGYNFKQGYTTFDIGDGQVKQTVKLPGAVHALAISPDGKTVATIMHEGDVTLHDADGKAIKTIKREKFSFTGLAFAPDGKTLAASTKEGVVSTVRLYDSKTGELQKTLEEVHRLGVRSLVFTADGKTIVTAGDAAVVNGSRSKGEVKAWDLDSGTGRVVSQNLPGYMISNAAISSDGKVVAAAYYRGEPRLWEVASGKELRVFNTGGQDVWSVAFSPDNKLLAVGQSDNKVRFFDVNSGKDYGGFKLQSIPWQLAFMPDGKSILIRQNESVELWPLAAARSFGVVEDPLAKLPKPPPKTDPPAKTDPPPKSTDLRKLIIGKWELVKSERSGVAGTALEFTSLLKMIRTEPNKPKGEEVGYAINFNFLATVRGETFEIKTLNERELIWADRQGKTEEFKRIGDAPKPDPVAKTDPPKPDPAKPDPPKPVTKTDPPKPDPVTKTEPPAKPKPEDMKQFLGVWNGNAGGFPEIWTFKEDNGQLVISAIYKRGNAVVGSWTGKDVKVTKGQVTFTEIWEKKPVPSWVSPMPVMVVPDGDRLKYSWGQNNYTDGSSFLSRVSTPAPAGTDPLVGTWNWFNGGTATVLADGTLLRNGKQAGTWKVIDASKRLYQLTWPAYNAIDDLTLSADGKNLEGKNQNGLRVTATRAGDKDPVVGTWKWFDGSQVTVAENGSFTQNGKRGGTWRAMDAGKREYQLRWSPPKKSVDELTLSADGKSLDGKNQFGQRVTGTKTGD